LVKANGANGLERWQKLMVQMDWHKVKTVDGTYGLASWQKLMVQMDWQVGNS